MLTLSTILNGLSEEQMDMVLTLDERAAGGTHGSHDSKTTTRKTTTRKTTTRKTTRSSRKYC